MFSIDKFELSSGFNFKLLKLKLLLLYKKISLLFFGFVSENILEQAIIENYTSQIIDVGTSKFLAKNKAHLEDTMYLLNETTLMAEPNQNSSEICTILKSLDVTLKALENEEWCRVEFDGIEGYVKTKYLTTSFVTPKIVEANRIQRIKMKLSEDMPLNQSTGLSLEDYKRILAGNSPDRKHIIEDNAEAFYNAFQHFKNDNKQAPRKAKSNHHCSYRQESQHKGQ